MATATIQERRFWGSWFRFGQCIRNAGNSDDMTCAMLGCTTATQTHRGLAHAGVHIHPLQVYAHPPPWH